MDYDVGCRRILVFLRRMPTNVVAARNRGRSAHRGRSQQCSRNERSGKDFWVGSHQELLLLVSLDSRLKESPGAVRRGFLLYPPRTGGAEGDAPAYRVNPTQPS